MFTLPVADMCAEDLASLTTDQWVNDAAINQVIILISQASSTATAACISTMFLIKFKLCLNRNDTQRDLF